MKRATVALTAVLLAIGPLARPAFAVSATDLLNLQAHGLGDEVLVALIETDGSSFRLSASDIERLRAKGMRDAVIVAMLEADRRAARRTAELSRRNEERPAPQAPMTVVVANGDLVIVPVVAAAPSKPAQPIYWGYGGKPNPGSWVLPSQNDESRRAKR